MPPPAIVLDRFSLDLPELARVLPLCLPGFLPRQRWFGARSTPIRQAAAVESVPVADPDLPAAFALARVELADGSRSVYQLVLATADPRSVDPQHVLAHLKLPQGDSCLYDLLASAVDCEKLLVAVRRRAAASSTGARLVVDWTPALDQLVPPYKAKPVDSEQSNSSVVFGQGAILKVFRRVEPGLNPDIEVTKVLTAAGFNDIPQYLGSISYAPPGAEPSTLAGIQQYVVNQGDGWHDALLKVRAWLDDPSEPRLQRDARRAAELGTVTARLHHALASCANLAAFCPQPIVQADLRQWHDSARQRLERVSHALAPAHAAAVALLLDRLPDIAQPGLKIRIHGDYHLGQVLRSGERWIIFDFEGEPSRALGDRTSRYPAVRDVAGMLRSFDYAAFAAVFERAAPDSADWARFEPLATRWADHLRGAFLDGWMRGVRGASFVPAHEPSLSALLQAFELDKAVYEVEYELGHRPDWLRIPVQGIVRILNRAPHKPRS